LPSAFIFDPTDGETGALFVLLGGHLLSRANPRHSVGIVRTCIANVGDALLMRPLLLHRSPPAKGEGQRRVLHIVFTISVAEAVSYVEGLLRD
jgi:hypothetical protein